MGNVIFYYPLLKNNNIHEKEQGKGTSIGAPFFLPGYMKIKVFMKWLTNAETGKQELKCICMQNNKRCGHWCEKDIISYDQYQHLKDCFNNRPLKRSEK